MKTTTHNGYSFTLATLIAYTAIIFIVVLWSYIKWNRRHMEKLTSQMRGPKSYPIIGMAHNFIGTQQDILEKLIKIAVEYGPEPIKCWYGPYLGVCIIKPEDIQIVLNNSMAFQKEWIYCFLKKIFGEGLFTAPVDKWQVHRRIISPMFNINQIKHFLPIFHEKTQFLVRNLQIEVGKPQPFDLLKYVAPIALNTICQTAMGYDVGTESNSEFELFCGDFTKAIELTAIRMYKPWLHLDFVFSIYLRLIGHHDIYEKIKILPSKIIKENKAIYEKKKLANISNADHTEENEKIFKTFMDVLFEPNIIGNLSDKEIGDEVITMLIGGSETSAVTECFCLLMLAIHPDIQDKVYNEIYEVFGDSDQIITFEDANKLVYLEQVLNETLRLFPVAPMIVRKLQDDVKISNYTLPKGIQCVIPAIATHHRPELYPNPLTFNPENFNPENVIKRHRYSFIPFLGGPRGCIGVKYAMMSMKVFMAVFLQNFSVHTEIKFSDIKLKTDIILRSVHGYPVTIRHRNRVPTYN